MSRRFPLKSEIKLNYFLPAPLPCWTGSRSMGGALDFRASPAKISESGLRVVVAVVDMLLLLLKVVVARPPPPPPPPSSETFSLSWCCRGSAVIRRPIGVTAGSFPMTTSLNGIVWCLRFFRAVMCSSLEFQVFPVAPLLPSPLSLWLRCRL